MQQRVIRFLLDQSKKDPEKYKMFFEDYSLFVREGIVTTQEQDVKVTLPKCYNSNFSTNAILGETSPSVLPVHRRILQSCCGSSPPLCRRASRPV